MQRRPPAYQLFLAIAEAFNRTSMQISSASTESVHGILRTTIHQLAGNPPLPIFPTTLPPNCDKSAATSIHLQQWYRSPAHQHQHLNNLGPCRICPNHSRKHKSSPTNNHGGNLNVTNQLPPYKLSGCNHSDQSRKV